jgi:hypothetical protein
MTHEALNPVCVIRRQRDSFLRQGFAYASRQTAFVSSFFSDGCAFKRSGVRFLTKSIRGVHFASWKIALRLNASIDNLHFSSRDIWDDVTSGHSIFARIRGLSAAYHANRLPACEIPRGVLSVRAPAAEANAIEG